MIRSIQTVITSFGYNIIMACDLMGCGHSLWKLECDHEGRTINDWQMIEMPGELSKYPTPVGVVNQTSGKPEFAGEVTPIGKAFDLELPDEVIKQYTQGEFIHIDALQGHASANQQNKELYHSAIREMVGKDIGPDVPSEFVGFKVVENNKIKEDEIHFINPHNVGVKPNEFVANVFPDIEEIEMPLGNLVIQSKEPGSKPRKVIISLYSHMFLSPTYLIKFEDSFSDEHITYSHFHRNYDVVEQYDYFNPEIYTKRVNNKIRQYRTGNIKNGNISDVEIIVNNKKNIYIIYYGEESPETISQSDFYKKYVIIR